MYQIYVKQTRIRNLILIAVSHTCNWNVYVQKWIRLRYWLLLYSLTDLQANLIYTTVQISTHCQLIFRTFHAQIVFKPDANTVIPSLTCFTFDSFNVLRPTCSCALDSTTTFLRWWQRGVTVVARIIVGGSWRCIIRFHVVRWYGTWYVVDRLWHSLQR